MNDNVNHPKHYTEHPSGVQCIEITRHMNFNLGNAIKYIWRSPLKGREIEDLRKAAFYINDEIARLEDLQFKKDIDEYEEKRTELYNQAQEALKQFEEIENAETIEQIENLSTTPKTFDFNQRVRDALQKVGFLVKSGT